MNNARKTRRKRRRQFRLRTLLLLVIPVALLACFLRFWFYQAPKHVKPSKFYTSLDGNHLESSFKQVVPGQFFSANRVRSGVNTSMKRGQWSRKFIGGLWSDGVIAERAMRALRSDVRKAVGQRGGKILEEQEHLKGSSLFGFRFTYVESDHSGTFAAMYGPETTHSDATPFRQLHIEIKEWTGYAAGEEPGFTKDRDWPDVLETIDQAQSRVE